MIIYTNSNLFTSPAKVLVNTVNTVGVMGKGIALEFKKLYPDMFKQYQKFCEDGQLTVGKLWLYKSPNKWILNFPTKKNWRNKSKLEYLESGLKKFVENYRRLGITSISFPELGAGNGGLNWETQVKPLMEKYLAKLPIRIYIHLYSRKGTEAEFMSIKETQAWLDSQPSLLSFPEVLEELRKSLAERPIAGVAAVKEVHTGEMTRAFHVKHDTVNYFLTRHDLEESWASLRNVGILMPLNYPGVVIKHGDYEIFEKLWLSLNYVTKTKVESGNRKMNALFLRRDKLPSVSTTLLTEQLG